ncbi:hypothetical protein AVEN_172043-1 [Araneus ventricosus]|uniref:Uncharacterized protein n=1 Tax=Araneus ventricosus TaxID=182803 RepID=A0A4Y2NTT8_ARAVE|nr:hypothetical protein AVEN_131869-1 [Araneus ventricosus]GBN42736.1 hypothetical protein AVEN_172043-1 [Araneus ventricosus]
MLMHTTFGANYNVLGGEHLRVATHRSAAGENVVPHLTAELLIGGRYVEHFAVKRFPAQRRSTAIILLSDEDERERVLIDLAQFQMRF